MKELNYNIKASAKNTIRALGYIQGASAKIYSLSNLVTPVWTGTVDSTGKVVDIYGNSPYLNYDDYRVVIEKCDYDTEISDFRVPDTSLVNLTIGCSSAITAHESNYDHGKLTSINNNILKDVIPTYAGFQQFPLPVGELTDDNFSDFTTYGQISSNIGYHVNTATVTFDFGTSRYISTIPYILKYGLYATYYAGSAAYARIKVQIYNGVWIDFHTQTVYPPCTSGGPCTTDTGVVTVSNVIPYYSNLSQIRIFMEESAQSSGHYLNNAGVTLYGTRILAFG